MSEEIVLCEILNDGVAVLTLNRPERMNAWTSQLEEQYFNLLGDCDKDDQVRAIVVTGAGKGFCPGADTERMLGRDGPTSSATDMSKAFPLSIRKPLIGAINGACAGVGLVQALMFDVRFAAAGAKFTFAFARRGLVAEYGSSWLLPRIVGLPRAIDLLLSSRVFTSEEALNLGLVNFVTPQSEVLQAATSYAAELSRECSPTSMAVIKRQVLDHLSLDLHDALSESGELRREALLREDSREGIASYMEKRLPNFPPLGP